MDYQITVCAPGDAGSLCVTPYASEQPGPGEIRVRHEAIGVNFIDIYHRLGLYALPAHGVPGVVAAGIVEATGREVTGLEVGQRIVYAGVPVGAYRSTRLLPASRAIVLPEDISAREAAASMFKGLTAYLLLTGTYAVGPGSVLLVHAAAGGLGMMLTRWAKSLGAMVIGSVGSEGKAMLARENGADHVIIGRDADIVHRIEVLTEGRGVDYAIDGIGGPMLAKTRACVRSSGTVASIGLVAGPVLPPPPEGSGRMRAHSLVYPSVMAHSAQPDFYISGAAKVLEMIRSGVTSPIGGEFPLADAAHAHASIETGGSTGSLLLIP
jgi:NADPH2:quinone reductase